ncbi:hypothetical protein [Leptodesmis sp.]|uniref:hypothetical protein n=1 Tax=Leptodesmis sp. TaxID=3100501 RepID=UPI0040534B10
MTISLIAAFVRLRTQEEMTAILSTIVAIGGLLISFVLAPWIVQILILLGSLGAMRYYCYRHSCQNRPRTR